MSPKRRYQSSSIGISLPSPFQQTEQYYRPITPAELTGNPVVTSRPLPLTLGGFQKPRTPVDEYSYQHDSHQKKSSSSGSHAQGQSYRSGGGQRNSSSRGDRTYRVHPTPVTSVRSSLSQGIFGLPEVNNYWNRNEDNYEDLGGTKILDEIIHEPVPISLKEPLKPRMRATLPSSKPVQSSEEMDGILQVRPASRSNNSVPAHHYQHHNTNNSPRSRTAVANQSQEQSGHQSGYGHSHSPGSRRPMVRRSQSNTGVIGSGQRLSPTAAAPDHYQQFDDASGQSPKLDDIGSRLSQLPARTSRPSTPVDNAHQLSPGMVENMLQDSVMKLKSSDWEEICEAFRQVTNLTEYYPFQVRGSLKKIIWSGLPHLSSSRTKVSRSACQCFKRLFETQRRSMEGEGDKVFSRLLDLSGGPSNKFIQEECKDALLAAVGHTDPLKCITLIEVHGAKHKNPNVREFAVYLLHDVMSRLTVDKLLGKDYCHKVIPLIVGFLREGRLNTRLNAKDCLEKIFEHPTFDSKLKRFVSPENIRHVNDILKKFRVRRVKSIS